MKLAVYLAMKFNFNLNKRELYSYEDYRSHIANLLKEGKTTGLNQSEEMIAFTELNEVRMNRWEKTFKPDEALVSELKELGKMHWLAITEGWCGDSAQNLPMINKIANQLPDVELKFILRDDNLDIMDAFLSNNKRSIPKLIAMDAQHNILFQWGPRPLELQKLFLEMREQNVPNTESKIFIHKWYAKDKGKALQADLLRAVKVKQVS